MYAASCTVKGNRVKSNLVRVLFMKLYIHNMCARVPFCGGNWVVSSLKETKYMDNIVSRAHSSKCIFYTYFRSHKGKIINHLRDIAMRR